jgi:hypothetical protein
VSPEVPGHGTPGSRSRARTTRRVAARRSHR